MQLFDTSTKILKFHCEKCDYNTSNKTNYKKHVLTKKHVAKMSCNFVAKKLQKVAKYSCKNCDYVTSKKTDYEKHIRTIKCKSVTMSTKVDNVDKKSTLFSCSNCDYTTCENELFAKHICDDKLTLEQNTGIVSNDVIFKCECGKTFKGRTGLWRHKKVCIGKDTSINKLIKMMVEAQQHNEQRYDDVAAKHDETIIKIMEMVKEISQDKSITNISNINSNNKSFNLNFFLNETCKDAYNISEFVEQLDVTMEDMLHTSRVGYTEGVSHIILKGLKALDITKRPIHCTDSKRETMYIKENNEWTKEGDEHPILLGAIKKIAGKNINNIFEWQKQHPDYRDVNSRNNDLHLKMMLNVMQGGTDNEIHNSFCTVFRNIARGSVVPK